MNNDRPIGIILLSILHFISGVGIILVPIFFHNPNLSNEIGISSVLMYSSILFLGVISILSAIGMWLGKSWGWWLGAFYYIYAIARYTNSIIVLNSLSDQLANSSRGSGYYFSRDIFRIITSGLIFIYFFKNNVREYFTLKNYSKIKSMGILVIITLALIIVATLIQHFF